MVVQIHLGLPTKEVIMKPVKCEAYACDRKAVIDANKARESYPKTNRTILTWNVCSEHFKSYVDALQT